MLLAFLKVAVGIAFKKPVKFFLHFRFFTRNMKFLVPTAIDEPCVRRRAPTTTAEPFHQLHTTAEDGLAHSYLELAHHAHNRTYSVFQPLMNHLYV